MIQSESEKVIGRRKYLGKRNISNEMKGMSLLFQIDTRRKEEETDPKNPEC